MQAGKLDRRVWLRRITEDTSSGSVVLTTTDVAQVWAQKQYDRGSEQFQQDQKVGWAVVVWRIRWLQVGLADVPTVKWELAEGERVYEVLETREIGRREGLELVTRCRAEDLAA